MNDMWSQLKKTLTILIVFTTASCNGEQDRNADVSAQVELRVAQTQSGYPVELHESIIGTA